MAKLFHIIDNVKDYERVVMVSGKTRDEAKRKADETIVYHLKRGWINTDPMGVEISLVAAEDYICLLHFNKKAI